ncbi:gaf sensor protein [Lasius niger]|uniref:Gaf sensor protein n=1 Tax=Lasius niger TaxID=67767 RepID=A0A0J7K9T1_LASNI|nr:gaf sensor protein [Lasius niger]
MRTAPIQKISQNDLLLMAKGLIEGENDSIALLANLSALISEAFDETNWVGFYRLIHQELVLGPFQGRIACTRIPLGKGVCGTAAAEKRTLRIEDVHDFPGHIACDSASNSEIVVPLLGKDAKLYGVLDIDSPKIGRFSQAEQKLLEEIVSHLTARLDQIPCL